MVHLLSMVSFFACTCPNRSGVGAIDNSDRFEQVFDQYDNPEDSEKISRRNFDGGPSERVRLCPVRGERVKGFY